MRDGGGIAGPLLEMMWKGEAMVWAQKSILRELETRDNGCSFRAMGQFPVTRLTKRLNQSRQISRGHGTAHFSGALPGKHNEPRNEEQSASQPASSSISKFHVTDALLGMSGRKFQAAIELTCY